MHTHLHYWRLAVCVADVSLSKPTEGNFVENDRH